MGTKRNPGRFDCYAKAGDDEPIFTLRAKDPHAYLAIAYWCSVYRQAPDHDPEKLEEARALINDIHDWRATNIVLPTPEVAP